MGVHGNSATATKLQTARSIAIGGAVKGSANFDGSGNVTINTSQNNIFVLSATGTLNNGYGYFEVPYPNGLNEDNCTVISLAIKGIVEDGWCENAFSGSYLLESRLYINKIVLKCNYLLDNGGSNKNVTIRAILMKIN